MWYLHSPPVLLASCSAWSWWHLEVAPASLSHQATGKKRRGEGGEGGEGDEKERRRLGGREEEERRRLGGGGRKREDRKGTYNLAVESIPHFVPQSEECDPFEGTGREPCLGGKTTS